jgi:hypothetical protein
MIRRALAGVTVAIALSALIVVLTANPAAGNPVLRAPFRFDGEGCNYLCRDCSTPNAFYHDIVVHYQTNPDWSAHLESCNAGSCDGHACDDGGTVPGGDGQLLSPVEATIEDLVDAIHADSRRVRFNAARQSIQIFCDEGRIIANLPLTPSQVDGLRRAEAAGEFQGSVRPETLEH